MKGLASALRVMFALPPVWLAPAAVAAAAVTNETVMDILHFAAWRLGLGG